MSFYQLAESERIARLERLARKALAGYGLADAEITWQGGTDQAIFRISKSDEHGARTYALRVCNSDWPIDQLEREIAWLASLRRGAELHVPEPVLATDGTLVRRVGVSGVPGFRPCVLLRWVDGRRIDGESDAETMRRVGRFVAELHRHGTGYRWPDEVSIEQTAPETWANAILPRALVRQIGEGDAEAVLAAAEKVVVAIGGLGTGSDVGGVIHGDLVIGNLRLRGGEVGAFGFDRCRWGFALYDIASLLSDPTSLEAGVQLRDGLLNGYREVRALPVDAESLLPAFEAMHTIDRILRRLPADSQRVAISPEVPGRTIARLRAFADKSE